jgi:hypothetical protein
MRSTWTIALQSTEAVPALACIAGPRGSPRAQRNPAALGASCDDVDVLTALLSAGADIEQTVVASATAPAGRRVAFGPWHAADDSSNAAPRGRGCGGPGEMIWQPGMAVLAVPRRAAPDARPNGRRVRERIRQTGVSVSDTGN